ncbi:MAG: ABC transporter ATP-binding protein [Gemmatimonas sp.]
MPPAPPIEDEALGKAYDARLVRRLLRYVRPYRSLVVAALLLIAIESGMQLAGPLLTRWMIDTALPAGDPALVTKVALLFAASLLVAFGASYGETIFTNLLGQRVMRDLRAELFAHLQRLPISFFDKTPVGRLVTRVTSDVEALNELFTSGVVAGLGDLFTLLAISIVMLTIDWKLALASFFVIPLVFIASRVFQSRVRSAYRDIRTRLARVNAFLQERLSGIRVVQLFGRERDELARFDKLNDAHLESHLHSITIYALYFPVIEFLTTLALASLVLASGWRMENGVLTIGTLAAFLQLVRRFFQPLQDLSEKYNILQAAMASSERVFAVMDLPTAPGVQETPDREQQAATLRAEGVTITFDDVWFAYGVGGVADDSVHGVNDPDTVPSTQVPINTQIKAPGNAPGTANSGAINAPGTAINGPINAAGTANSGAINAPGTAINGPINAADMLKKGAENDAEPRWVLHGVSFEARPGQTVALVGHTGAGKTTIVNLLLRFYEPQRGRILINGRDIRHVPVDVLRSLIGYIQQDIFLFAGDVASNLRLGAMISDEELERAADRVGATRVIQRLPGGWRHELAERGASVSVGERQLLAFARAVAANPALLVLDEATSAVDSEIEADIQFAVAELMRGRTTIAIAHRLSTIVTADEILVLHHGAVLERGTHRSLLSLGGLYERLFRLQVGDTTRAAEAQSVAVSNVPESVSRLPTGATPG